MILYNVIVSSGYAEDEINSHLWMNYTHEEKLTGQQIAEHLKGVLQEFVKDEHSKKKKNNCCKTEEKTKSKFCSECGRLLESMQNFDVDAKVAEVIRELVKSTCESTGYELVEFLENNDWNIWGTPVNGPFIWLKSFDDSIDPERNHHELEIIDYNAEFLNR